LSIHLHTHFSSLLPWMDDGIFSTRRYFNPHSLLQDNGIFASGGYFSRPHFSPTNGFESFLLKGRYISYISVQTYPRHPILLVVKVAHHPGASDVYPSTTSSSAINPCHHHRSPYLGRYIQVYISLHQPSSINSSITHDIVHVPTYLPT